MKKTYKLEELDCANCAAKMESGIKKIDGVMDASVNFFAQKLIIETEEDGHEGIMDEVKKIIRKIEPGCRVII